MLPPHDAGAVPIRVLFLLAGIGLLVYLVIDLGPGRIVEMLGRVGWHAVTIAVVYAAYQSVRAAALVKSVLGPRRLTWRDALSIRLSGEAVQFLTFTGPFLAEPAKAWLLRQRGLTAHEGFAATLTEYLVNNFVGALFAVIALGWLLTRGDLPDAARAGIVVALVLVGAFLLAAAVAIPLRAHLLGTILERLIALPGFRSRVRVDMAAVHRTEDILHGVLHDRPGRFALVAALQAASHALHYLELVVILHALDLEADLWTAFVIEGAAKIAGVVFFFVPAQVGAAEGTYTLIFSGLGLPLAAGFAVPFIRRIRMVALSTAGVAAMWAASRRDRGTG